LLLNYYQQAGDASILHVIQGENGLRETKA
jgi:hypothetical protein